MACNYEVKDILFRTDSLLDQLNGWVPILRGVAVETQLHEDAREGEDVEGVIVND